MTLAAAILITACAWNAPGADPYRGDVPAAVEHYTDIPAPTRAKLRQRMERRQYDDVAEIRRDSIEGASSYTGLRSMHFGANKICSSVTRAGWSDSMRERGLVYCEDGHCLLVPTVCNNVSRVDRIAPSASGAEPAAGVEPLAFDPPGSGLGNAPFIAAPAETFAAGAAPVLTAGPMVFADEGVFITGPRPPLHSVPSPVPEPAAVLLMLGGLGMLVLRPVLRLLSRHPEWLVYGGVLAASTFASHLFPGPWFGSFTP